MRTLRDRGFQFEERMSGTYRPIGAANGQAAQSYPIEFQAQVSATSVLEYIKNGKAQLWGTLHAYRLADGVPVHGEMEIRPVTGRIIRYQMYFTGDDGKPYILHGEKRLRLAQLRHTLTHLPVGIRDDAGATVAEGALDFNLRSDWFSFLRSWHLM